MILIAPESAPQVYVPPLKNIEHPLAGAVFSAVRRHGNTPVSIWKIVNSLANARNPACRAQRRSWRLRFLCALRELLRFKVIYRHGPLIATSNFAIRPRLKSPRRLSPSVGNYSRFDPGFDQIGSSHNGGFLAAIASGVPFATPGLRADGRNKFMVSFENWRADPQEPSPGRLNVYCYHPEQRTEYGDHFFPTGEVLPFSYRPGEFGPHFVARPEIVPALGRWYCYEIMLQANTVGQRDGRIACWVDGQLIADFPNLRLREVETLKINYAALDLHIKSNPIRENRKWYDDVVIATSYIGPIAPHPLTFPPVTDTTTSQSRLGRRALKGPNQVRMTVDRRQR